MAGETIDFNSGASLASLGFHDITGLTNAAGVGRAGTYAMQATDRFDEAQYTVAPTGRALCLTFWWNRTITNGSVYLFEAMAGTAFLYNVSIQVVSGSTNGLIQSRAGFSDSVTGLWPSSFPSYVRIEIVPSTAGTFASPDADGRISIWHGPSLDALTEAYSRSDIEIYDFTKDAQPAYNRFHFAPQGVIDDIVWRDSLCSAVSPINNAQACCSEGTGAPTSNTGGLEAGGDPTRPTQPWDPACAGGGTVPTASDPAGGETFA